jgi:hypothetical protein
LPLASQIARILNLSWYGGTEIEGKQDADSIGGYPLHDTNPRISVLLVEDNPAFLKYVVALARREPMLDIMGTAEAGAGGYVNKMAAAEDLVAALVSVYKGMQFLTPCLGELSGLTATVQQLAVGTFLLVHLPAFTLYFGRLPRHFVNCLY